MEKKRTIFTKTIIAFLVATIVPVVLFFIGGMFFLYGGMSSPHLLIGSRDLFGNVGLLAFFCLILPLPISFAHLLVLGIPAFLVGWWFRAIRWWPVLITSFLIGAVPVSIFGFVREFEWPSGFDLFTSLGIVMIGSSVIFIMAGIMGLFGVSGGLAFWFLWQNWASPDSPAGRPLSLSLNEKEQDINTLSERGA